MFRQARIWIVTTALSAAGCLSPHRSVVTSTPIGQWEGAVGLTFHNPDTLTPRDILVFVRYNELFDRDSLRLIVRTTRPDSLSFEESFLLSVPHGRRAAALHNEVLVPYRHRAILSQVGEYHMAFSPTQPVLGIEAIGIDIRYGKR